MFKALVMCAFLLAGCSEVTRQGVYMEAPSDGHDFIAGALTLGEVRFKDSVCKDEARAPEFAPLTEEALASFLQTKGYEVRKLRARSDLVYLDVKHSDGTSLRLRVAILSDAHAAGRELHQAILDHGPGSWGVHRSNLAVLAPIGSLGQIVHFSVKSKLACWGVLTAAGLDDTFVIAGGYTEL
jgi:hypothetical protein